MLKSDEALAKSQRAAHPTLKSAFIYEGDDEASYSKAQNSDAQALSSEFDGNYAP